MRLGFFATLFVVILLPVAVSAQTLGDLGGASGDAFTLSANPQYPPPYSQTIVSVFSNLIELSNSTMTASVNGKEIYKGAVRPFSVTLGKAGSVTNVKVGVSSGGTNYNQTISIQPQDIVLIVEPISSSPPLYSGKSLIPIDGSTRIVAVANLKDASGNSSSPTSYSYEWTVDGVRIANSSGIGKSSTIVSSPLRYRTRSVSVAVTNTTGSLVGGASLSFSSAEPSIRIYENDPLLGIRYDRALSGGYTIGGAEATLYAAPFSLPTTSGLPLIQWFLNGTAAQTGNSITMRPTGDGKGFAALSLVASTAQSGTATANLSLVFGAKQDTNFFGL